MPDHTTEKPNMCAMRLMLPPSLVQELDKQAQQEGGQSRGAIIRRACAEYLRQRQAQQTTTEQGRAA